MHSGGRGKLELPLQYAAQHQRLAGSDKGSGVTVAADMPSQAGAVQTSSPPFPWLVGIRSGSAAMNQRPCA